MKILVIPSSLNDLNHDIDGFIIGIKNFATYGLCIDDLSILNKLKNKEIFININKNMHNCDLEKLKDILLSLNNYNIKGVMYYDVAVLELYKSLNLNYDLVWSCEHYTTNYETINYFLEYGVNYTYLSSDITASEVNEIRHNTNCKLILNLFGYLPMFVSKRHIVKNYLDYFNLDDNSKINYMEKEGCIYPIIDNNIGTQVYSCNILNGIKYYDIDVDYIVLNSFNIDESKFKAVLDMFKSVNSKNVDKYYLDINRMFDNTDLGFLEKNTIYRVKKNEKES